LAEEAAVPREFVGRRIVPVQGATSGMRARSIGLSRVDGPADADLEAGIRFAEEAEAYRECPECGSVRHSQRRVRT
jgi:rubredoxin